MPSISCFSISSIARVPQRRPACIKACWRVHVRPSIVNGPPACPDEFWATTISVEAATDSTKNVLAVCDVTCFMWRDGCLLVAVGDNLLLCNFDQLKSDSRFPAG